MVNKIIQQAFVRAPEAGPRLPRPWWIPATLGSTAKWLGRRYDLGQQDLWICHWPSSIKSWSSSAADLPEVDNFMDHDGDAWLWWLSQRSFQSWRRTHWRLPSEPLRRSPIRFSRSLPPSRRLILRRRLTHLIEATERILLRKPKTRSNSIPLPTKKNARIKDPRLPLKIFDFDALGFEILKSWRPEAGNLEIGKFLSRKYWNPNSPDLKLLKSHSWNNETTILKPNFQARGRRNVAAATFNKSNAGFCKRFHFRFHLGCLSIYNPLGTRIEFWFLFNIHKRIWNQMHPSWRPARILKSCIGNSMQLEC